MLLTSQGVRWPEYRGQIKSDLGGQMDRITHKHLKEFKKEIYLREISLDLVRRFDSHLSEKGISQSGKFPIHRCFRKVIKEAFEENLIKQYPYRKFKVSQPKKREVFLTLEEVERIRNLNIPEDKGRVSKVRDMFLFSCYTGLRYSDIERLSWSHISDGEKVLCMIMQKTRKRVKIPLLEKAKVILRKYKSITGGKKENLVFAPISNQKANAYLKEMAQIAGINKHLTTHVARHTFASNLVEFGISPFYIRDLLGLKSLEMTQIYAKTKFEEIEKVVDEIAF
jgi:integrase/recombinase XerD